MKKNVEKLDELEEALKNAQEELIVRLIKISHQLFLYELNLTICFFCIPGLEKSWKLEKNCLGHGIWIILYCFFLCFTASKYRRGVVGV